jgi:hypothetical protein
MIAHGMHRQTLDAPYNNSAAVADSDQYHADWLRRSEALRAHAGSSRSGLWRCATDKTGLFCCQPPRHCNTATLLFFMAAIGSATPRKASALLPKHRSPSAYMLLSRATPWRRKPGWMALSARRPLRCIGCILFGRQGSPDSSHSSDCGEWPS